MKTFVIEREIPGIGQAGSDELCDAARTSNDALSAVGPGIQWQHSYVAADRTYCVYLAENEELIRSHAEKSGFPADRISRVTTTIDPTTAEG